MQSFASRKRREKDAIMHVVFTTFFSKFLRRFRARSWRSIKARVLANAPSGGVL
jgi:hypothetical protein